MDPVTLDDAATRTDSLSEWVERILTEFTSDTVEHESIRAKFPGVTDEVLHRVDTAVAIRRAQRLAEIEQTDAGLDGEDLVISDDELEFLHQHIPGYRFIQPLGRGGQAVVYEAVQESTRRVVAIKLLREGPLASPSQVTRFIREISFVSSLRHPNIAQVYESGVLRGHYWFSMERIQNGERLDDFVLLNRPNIASIVGLVATLARAIGFAHQKGVIHRDIKPSNILVDDEGVPHIVDFGLAKEIEDNPAGTVVSTEGQFIGTLPYLSPEQVSENSRADVRSDVYALGLVLYQLVTGGFPFEISESPFETRDQILRNDPVRPRKMRDLCLRTRDDLPEGVISDDLETIILKSIAKERDRRYQSMLDFAADLEACLRGEAIRAKADDYAYNLRKLLKRYRTQVGVAAGFVVLLVVSLVVAIALWRRADRIAFIAQSGLDAAAYCTLGSTLRDMGRFDDAMVLFESSIKISEETDFDDPTLLIARFEACQRAAWMLYGRDDLQMPNRSNDLLRADRLLSAAENALIRGSKVQPDNEFWEAKAATLYLVRAVRDETYRNHEGAFAQFSMAAAIFDGLVDKHPDDLQLKRDCALSKRHVAKSLLKLFCHEQAKVVAEEALALSEAVLNTKSAILDDHICTLRTLRIIACCHIRRKNVLDDYAAIVILNEAIRALGTLTSEHPNHGLEKQVGELFNDMLSWRQYIENRIANRMARGEL